MNASGPRRRRALSNVGGQVHAALGSPRDREALTRALVVGCDDESTREHVHGFHSYPARMHPHTARTFVEAFGSTGQVLLDPFCGSGTVLVEGRLLGRCAVGSDLNPLAIELAWLKARGTTPHERSDLLAAAARVAAYAEERRIKRQGATRRYGADDVQLFDPHVLLELDGLFAGVVQQRNEQTARVLRLVLSSILVKVSRQPGDTSQALAPRRLASGHVVRLFEAKSRELTRRLESFANQLPPMAPGPTARVANAQALPLGDQSVDLIVTSPPYPSNYDYLSHHAVRLRWLSMPDQSFARDEIGARRQLEQLPYSEAVATWNQDFSACLREMRRVLKESGRAVLLIADTVVSGRPFFADESTRALAGGVGLTTDSVASQIRPHFHYASSAAFRHKPRREHAMLLRPSR